MGYACSAAMDWESFALGILAAVVFSGVAGLAYEKLTGRI